MGFSNYIKKYVEYWKEPKYENVERDFVCTVIGVWDNTEWVPPLNWRNAGQMESQYTDLIRAPRKRPTEPEAQETFELVVGGTQSKDLYGE